MSGLVSPPKIVVSPPSPPQVDNEAMAGARRREMQRLLLTRRGRGATILTGGDAGAGAPLAPAEAGKRLLGA